jgi:hypothetical protein
MKGIQFLVDGEGKKTAVVIDLKKNPRIWDDFYDRVLAEQRATEPRETLDSVKKKFAKRRRRRTHG